MASIIAAIITGLFSIYVVKYRHNLKMKENSSQGDERNLGATKYDVMIIIIEVIVFLICMYFIYQFVYYVYYKFFYQMILEPIFNWFY